MSRRRALSLATRLVAAADELSTAAARQQVGCQVQGSEQHGMPGHCYTSCWVQPVVSCLLPNFQDSLQMLGTAASVQLLQAAARPAASAQQATAALSTAAALRPLPAAAAAATPLLPGTCLASAKSSLQPSLLHVPTRGLSTSSSTTAAGEHYEEGGAGALDPELPGGGGYTSRGSRFATATEAAEYVKSNINRVSSQELGAVVRDFVELHFAQVRCRWLYDPLARHCWRATIGVPLELLAVGWAAL